MILRWSRVTKEALVSACSWKGNNKCIINANLSFFSDGGKTKFKVIAVPRHGEGAVLRYGDADHDDDVEDGTAFPPIPPAALPSRLPQIIHDKHGIKVRPL